MFTVEKCLKDQIFFPHIVLRAGYYAGINPSPLLNLHCLNFLALPKHTPKTYVIIYRQLPWPHMEIYIAKNFFMVMLFRLHKKDQKRLDRGHCACQVPVNFYKVTIKSILTLNIINWLGLFTA